MSTDQKSEKRNLGIRANEKRAKILKTQALRRDLSVQRMVDEAIDLYLKLSSEQGVECPNCAAGLRYSVRNTTIKAEILSVPKSEYRERRRESVVFLVHREELDWYSDLREASKSRAPGHAEIFQNIVTLLSILAREGGKEASD